MTKTTQQGRKCRECAYMEEHCWPFDGWCYWRGEKRRPDATECDDGWMQEPAGRSHEPTTQKRRQRYHNW